MSDEDPFFPTAAVLVDLERVDANLGLEEGGGSCAVGEREGVVARAVVVHGGGGKRSGGLGRDQGGERRQQETQASKSRHGEGGRDGRMEKRSPGT